MTPGGGFFPIPAIEVFLLFVKSTLFLLYPGSVNTENSFVQICSFMHSIEPAVVAMQ